MSLLHLLSGSNVRHSAERANSYDDAWQADWGTNVNNILTTSVGLAKTTGKVLQVGDSMTYSAAYGAWTLEKAGASVEDLDIMAWMYAGDRTDDDGWKWSINGTTAVPSTGWGAAWIDDIFTNPLLNDAQFAVIMFAPNDMVTVENRLNQFIAAGIVPIMSTIPPRFVETNPDYDETIADPYNADLKSLAQTLNLPIIDYNTEIKLRRPAGTWLGTLISDVDGVHPTGGVNGYTGQSSPYIDGGDAEAGYTGAATLNSGYLLRTWLSIQKMTEVRQQLAQSLPLASISDFVYAGAFRLPEGRQVVSGVPDFKFSGNRAAFGACEDRTKFFAACQPFVSDPDILQWAQCNIPEGLDPGIDISDGDFSALPIATVAQGPANIRGNCTRPGTQPNRTKYAYEYGGLMIGNCQHDYEGDAGRDEMLWRVLDSSAIASAGVEGYISASGHIHNAREMAVGWFGEIPLVWQPFFNNHTHFAGSAGHFNRVEGYCSDGPSLFLVDLDQFTGTTTPSVINYEMIWSFPEAVEMSMFRNKYTNLIGVFGWDGAVGFPREFRAANSGDVRYNMYRRSKIDIPAQDVDWPEQGDVPGNDMWTNHDRVGIGFMIDGTRTYACFGKAEGHVDGMGYRFNNDVGHFTSGPMPYVNSDRYNFAWFFDLNDAVDCLNGSKTSNDVIPYEYAEYQAPFERPPIGRGGEDSGYITGGWWDPDNKRLYLGILGADLDNIQPIICVYDYTG